MAMGVQVLLLALTQLLAFGTAEHVVYNVKMLEGGEGVCPDDQQTRTVLTEIDREVMGVVTDRILPRIAVGLLQSIPANSCTEILELHPGLVSGNYWVRNRNGTAVEVYCDMDRVCGCTSTGGWTRVANLNMSNTSQEFPHGWTLQTHSSGSKRLCGRGSSGAYSCVSSMYSTFGISYSHVCGRVIGYAYGTPDAFHSVYDTLQ